MRLAWSVHLYYMVSLAGLIQLVAIVGCQHNQLNKACPESPAYYPAFVYPPHPPIVDRQKLEQLMARLDGEITILWVMGRDWEKVRSTAEVLSRNRHAVQQFGGQIIGLYTGQSRDWTPQVVPALKSAGGNFPCAVLAPPAKAGMAAWLTGDPRQIRPGLYVVDRLQRVVCSYRPDSQAVKTLIEDLTKGGILEKLRRQEVFCIRARLIRLADGKVLANAVSEADKTDILASDLAGQLTGAVSNPGVVALIPFRRIGHDGGQWRAIWSTFAIELTELLQANGWPAIVEGRPVQKVLAQRGLTAMSVEFDPSRLATRVSWRAILVGSIEQRKLAGDQ
jgi:hypothetical protein